jgi:hypothetical protein
MQKMRYVGSILLLAIALSGISGCNPAPAKSESSSIIIQLPSHNKVGSLSYPGGYTACYGVNITGAGIHLDESSCHPAFGITSLFAAEGTAMNLEVPYGSNYRLQLFAYLHAGGSCPTSFAGAFTPNEISKVYYVGGVPNFNVNSPETNLSLIADFPGLANNIATQNSYAPACTGTAQNDRNFFVGSGAGQVTNGTINMRARVGRAVDAPVLTNGNIKLQVK